jgi:hypothetical protein
VIDKQFFYSSSSFLLFSFIYYIVVFVSTLKSSLPIPSCDYYYSPSFLHAFTSSHLTFHFTYAAIVPSPLPFSSSPLPSFSIFIFFPFPHFPSFPSSYLLPSSLLSFIIFSLSLFMWPAEFVGQVHSIQSPEGFWYLILFITCYLTCVVQHLYLINLPFCLLVRFYYSFVQFLIFICHSFRMLFNC